jgi:hypothetical protein
MKDGPMRTKLHKVIFSALLAASVAVIMPSPAHANRGNGGGGYVPPTNPGTPPVNVQVDLPGEPTVPLVDGSGNGGDPGAETAPEVKGISVDSPVVDSGAPATQGTTSDPAPANDGGVFGGVLSRTGAETMPLARAGLAAITLGLGLVMLSRRQRQAAAAA